MRRLPMASLTSLDPGAQLGASPSTAVLAVRRKLDTVMPGPPRVPAWPGRAPPGALVDAHGQDVPPSRVIEPPVTVYFGWPAME